MKLFQRLSAGLARTRDGLVGRLSGLFSGGAGRRLDEILDELEEILLQSDVGPAVAADLVARIRRQAGRDRTVSGVDDLKGLLASAIASLEGGSGATPSRAGVRPFVTFLVGVNGGGKTTTAAKLAARRSRAGERGVLAAADTFRAAAIDQLEVWAKRAGVELVRHQDGSDPSAVVFDALKAARARDLDFVIVDTAGRLHTKTPLMKELEKTFRIAAREVEGAPHESLLVIDATTGQNGIAQAREFVKAGRISGLVLTKLDGTARGGVAIGVSRELGIPLRYVGVGEGLDDLLDFSMKDYIEGLLAAAPSVAPPSSAA